MSDLSDFQRHVYDPLVENYKAVKRERAGWKSLCLDMGEHIEAVRHACMKSGIPTDKSDALLARLDRLGKEEA